MCLDMIWFLHLVACITELLYSLNLLFMVFQSTDSTARSFVETAEKMLSESLNRSRNLNECKGNHNVPSGFVLPIQLFNIRSFIFLNLFLFADSYTARVALPVHLRGLYCKFE